MFCTVLKRSMFICTNVNACTLMIVILISRRISDFFKRKRVLCSINLLRTNSFIPFGILFWVSFVYFLSKPDKTKNIFPAFCRKSIWRLSSAFSPIVISHSLFSSIALSQKETRIDISFLLAIVINAKQNMWCDQKVTR